MKKFRLRSLVIFGLAGLTGGTLLYTSQNVQRAEEELAALQSSIAQEQETIRVLSAEWSYLNSPARLELLASQYLDVSAPGARDVADHMVSAPTSLPESSFLQEQDALFQNISHDDVVVGVPPEPEPARKTVTVKPPRKPDIPRQSFNALLKSLEEGGAQ